MVHHEGWHGRGSRFFQLPKSDGTTADVKGIYCFQQSLHYKCLYYAVAVLLPEPDAPPTSGPTSIRLVIELSFLRSHINKRGKQTDQCIVQQAAVSAIHVQVAPAEQLDLGTQTMDWSPQQEAHPEQYAKMFREAQAASGSGDEGKCLTPCISGERSSAPAEGTEMLTLSRFDPERGEGQAGIDTTGTRSQ